VLASAAHNHRSWFGRGRDVVECEGVTAFVGASSVLAFPDADADLSAAVAHARTAGAREISCWSLHPDAALGERLSKLGFQDGWRPHWMGLDVGAHSAAALGPYVEETTLCRDELPYGSAAHRAILGGDVHHFVARDETGTIVGHAVLNVAGDTAGIYDMGVVAAARRRGFGASLLSAALLLAGARGCTDVTLNATGEGEPLYRGAGFISLGLGMTWWLFPRR
jgi:GNAT superfamily N-acetyltransferase